MNELRAKDQLTLVG